MASKRSVSARGRSERSISQLPAILRTFERLSACTDSSGLRAEVRALFKAGRRVIAGCSVTDGVIHRRDRVRVMRGGTEVWQGGVASMRREKDDVNEVRAGFECGILLDGFDEVAEGDVLEMFSSERV